MSSIAFIIAFAFFFIVRYLRLAIGILANAFYKPYPISDKPKIRPENVSVVVPTTFKTPAELVHCLRCIINCSPSEVFVVTSDGNVPLVRDLCALNSFKAVRALGVAKLNKRVQMLKALEEIDTELVVFADDDVFWPDNYLNHLLAIFEDEKVGAGGTRQRTRRIPGNMWNFLGIAYLERRVFNNITTNAIDGSISTLSGRTAAYRTKILATKEFYDYFTTDSWRGQVLSGDDDKALTRYVYSHGWNIAIQTSAVLETTLDDGPNYLNQCLRWARGHFRGNFLVMAKETYWRSAKYPFGLYAIYLAQFQTPSFLVDSLLFGSLYLALAEASASLRMQYMIIFAIFVLFTKLVKLIPHFMKYPQDMRFIPHSLIFSYLHGILNVYALFTLQITVWGSQDLEELAHSRAQKEAVVPMLKRTMAVADGGEPTPGKTMEGDDYRDDVFLEKNPTESDPG